MEQAVGRSLRGLDGRRAAEATADSHQACRVVPAGDAAVHPLASTAYSRNVAMTFGGNRTVGPTRRGLRIFFAGRRRERRSGLRTVLWFILGFIGLLFAFRLGSRVLVPRMRFLRT